ncbi:MAG: APC family permease [Gammaproteobacteria bacterium]|nr:MAG: APC family permease [Gammaproteobacteria bacterium]
MGQLSRCISPATLFMLSVNAILGSGWLFAPLYAAKIAGPAALVSWVIGGLAAILIAFTFAELSAMLPVAGGTAQIPQLSHGGLVSFILSWIGWLSMLMLTTVEVQAVLQYAALFFPFLMHDVNGAQVLTLWGLLWAAILLLTLCIVNVLSCRGLSRINFALFIFKVFVIVLMIFSITRIRFNPHNFAGIGTSMVSVQGWQTILTAVAAGGVAFAFNGFKNGVEMAGEAKNLAVAIPLSTAGSVMACMLLYLGLQVCFIGALDPASMQQGWQHLKFAGDVGPFAGLAAGLGLLWLVKLLYVDAVISPSGAGLIYVTGTARVLYAMSQIGYVPAFLSRLNRQRLPMYAIFVNFLCGLFTFLPLPGWQAMANFLVSILVITYAMGPIALLSLRQTLPDKPRPFRLPMANILCVLAFYCCNLFSYWTGWDSISKLLMALSIGLMVFGIAYLRGNINMEKDEIKSGAWFIPYIIGLVVISYLGSFGGKNIIPFGWDFAVIALFSIGILYLAVGSRMSTLIISEPEPAVAVEYS